MLLNEKESKILDILENAVHSVKELLAKPKKDEYLNLRPLTLTNSMNVFDRAKVLEATDGEEEYLMRVSYVQFTPEHSAFYLSGEYRWELKQAPNLRGCYLIPTRKNV